MNKQKKDRAVQIMMTKDVFDTVTRAANSCGFTVSEFIRQSVRKELIRLETREE